jgi:tRNA-dihydrouridine synthase
MGSHPEQFGEAANDLVEAGYDLIDINFGCPVKKVLGRCRGGFLLSDPRGALEIVKSVIDAVDGRRPVTLKMRRGFDDSLESESKFLARVKRHVGSGTILGSGDLFNSNAVMRMMDQTGVDGVTIARGAIGNPFIFRECRALMDSRIIEPPSIAEQREAMELHIAELLTLHNPVRAGAIFRKFGISYADLHPMRVEVRQAFINTRTIADIQAVVATWYDDQRTWPPVLPRDSITDLIAAGSAG